MSILTRTCLHCQRTFQTGQAIARYCDLTCRQGAYNDRRRGQYEIRVCAYCSREFRVAASKSQIHCGQACYDASNGYRPPTERKKRTYGVLSCQRCGRTFTAIMPTQTYCSKSCRNQASYHRTNAEARQIRRGGDETSVAAMRAEVIAARRQLLEERAAARKEVAETRERLAAEERRIAARAAKLAEQEERLARFRSVATLSGRYAGRCRECGGSLFTQATHGDWLLVACLLCGRGKEVRVGRQVTTAVPISERVNEQRLA